MDTLGSRKAQTRSTSMAELSATLIFCIFSQCHTCLTSQIQDSMCNRSMPAGDKVCMALQKLDSLDHHLGGRQCFLLAHLCEPECSALEGSRDRDFFFPSSSYQHIPGSHTGVTREPQLEGKGQL